jgi:predicted AlkP superfamily phosphohydrolase/phosphomutase
MRADRQKLVMIGIDAADLQFIHAHSNHLPNLGRLIEQGCTRLVAPSSPALDGAVWPNFCFGCPPGEHGFYFPMQWDTESMACRPVAEDWRYREPFWYDLARQGIAVTAFDMPWTRGAKMPHGSELVNWGVQGALGPFAANRPGLARLITSRFGSYPLVGDVPLDRSQRQLEGLATKLVDAVRRRAQIARWLLRETKWDLFLMTFAEVHRAGHALWPNSESRNDPVPPQAMRAIYAECDVALGVLLDEIDLARTGVMVFSNDGMGPNNSQSHFMSEVLARANAIFLGLPYAQGRRERRRGLVSVLRRRLPSALQLTIAERASQRVRDWVTSRAFAGAVDLKSDPAFVVPSAGEGLIRLNLVGRERPGLLRNHEDACRYKAWLSDRLLELRDAKSGAPIVQRVVDVAAGLPGTRSDSLPDLVVVWADQAPSAEIYSPQLGSFRAELATGRGGNHRRDGFVIAAGAISGNAVFPSQQTDFATFVRAAFHSAPSLQPLCAP